MKIMARWFVLVSLAAALSACTHGIPVSIGAAAKQYINGAPLKTWALSKMEIKALNDWLKRNSTGWSPGYASFAPRVLVHMAHANRMVSSVNFLEPDLVVVASMKGQFKQKFESKMIEQLLAIIAATSD